VDPVTAMESLYRLQLGYLGFGLLAGLVVLAVAFVRTVGDRARRPLKWLFWGGAVGFGPFVGIYLLPAAMGLPVSPWNELAALPLLLVPLSLASAVARYRLTDLELFFKRGLTAGALAGSTLAVYLAGALTFRRVFRVEATGVPEVLAVLLAALLIPRLKAVIGNVVDRIFYQDRYDHRRSLQEFGTELNRQRELRPLVEKLARRISRTLGVKRIAVLTSDPAGEVCRSVAGIDSPPAPLELKLDSALAQGLARSGALDLEDLRDPRADASPAEIFEAQALRYLVPLTVQGRLVALLALGERRDGAPLNSEDRELLEAVARHAAVAVEGARLFEEMQSHVEEIESLKDFNEGILETSHVGILVATDGERIAGWNRALAELTGITREAAMGRGLTEILGAEFAGLAARVRDGAASSGVRRFRHPLQVMGGEERLINLGFSALRLPGGGPSWVVTFDDVTADVRREELLIQQERLASIGLLASGVAHEVNTPLTGISSYAQMLLEETSPDDPRHGLLKKIEQQSFRASDIAHRLLNFSRPDRQDFVSLDLNELIEETLSLFEPQLRGCRVFVRRELDEALPRVRGHRGKLQQVLLNLLLNARDAMSEGGEICVRTVGAPDEIVVEVQDTGEGIRPEIVGRIYDPFFTTKGSGKGTGLGLSVTYGIVQEHSGTIGVESRFGEGTRFSVRLPVPQEAQAAAF